MVHSPHLLSEVVDEDIGAQAPAGSKQRRAREARPHVLHHLRAGVAVRRARTRVVGAMLSGIPLCLCSGSRDSMRVARAGNAPRACRQ